MSKKKKIIIAGAIAAATIALGIVVFAMSQLSVSQDGDWQGNVAAENANRQDGSDTNMFDDAHGQYSSTSDTIPAPSDSNATSSEGLPNERTAEEGSMNDEDAYNSRPGYHTYKDDLALSNINQEEAKRVASNFLKNFCTYNADSLKNNVYKSSWISDVMTTDDMGDLLKQRMNDAWSYNTSTYKEAYSALTNVTVDSVYISHAAHNDVVAVALTAIIDENQGEPGDFEWSTVNTNKVHYAVYLNQDLKVVDIRRQDAKTLNFDIFNSAGNGLYQ